MKIELFKHPERDGKPVLDSLDLIRVMGERRSWLVSRSRHNKSCRYGVYFNRTCRTGLKACINLPVIGDFSLWI